MPYDGSVARSNVALLEDGIPEIIQNAVEASAVLSLGRRLRDMSREQTTLRVMSEFPSAYFVTGDTGLKQTSEMSWEKVYINAEELAVIVPVPENVIDDTDYDIWGEVRPRIAEAIGAAVDAAILFGTNAPASWPDDIVTDATSASHVVSLAALPGSGVDLYDGILGEGGTVSMVEADGFFVNGHVDHISMRARYRGLRSAEGELIFKESVQGTSAYTLDGNPVLFPRNGAFNASAALDIAGDWSQLVYSIRKDITFKLGTEAIIQDGSGNIVLNTFQQDAVALRATFRMGWALPNPPTLLNSNDSTRYPFAILTA